MNFDIFRASQKLAKLDLNIISDNLMINVLWFRAMLMEGDWIITRHTHSSFEFHIIVSGACRVITDDGEFEVHEGEFYLTAPGVYHEQISIGQESQMEYSLNCDLKLMEDKECEERYILDILTNTPCKGYKDIHNICGIFNDALEEAYYERLGYFSNIKHFAAMIISNAARTLETESLSTYQVPVRKCKNDFRFEQIDRFVRDNISNPIQAGDIAHYMYLSDRHICRIIKEKNGMNTRDYILSIRLKKAKEYLKNTNLSIKEIAQTLGFSSEYYFNQFFSKQEGYPPGAYRKSVQNV